MLIAGQVITQLYRKGVTMLYDIFELDFRKNEKKTTVVVERNLTDDVFHIKLISQGVVINQVWGNLEDWKQIKKSLERLYKFDI